MSKSKGSVGRRGFLRGAAASAAGLAATAVGAAQQPEPPATNEPRGVVEVTGNEKPGSDFMVDVLKTLDAPRIGPVIDDRDVSVHPNRHRNGDEPQRQNQQGSPLGANGWLQHVGDRNG